MFSSETLYALFELKQRAVCAFLHAAHQVREYMKISVFMQLLAKCSMNCPLKLRGPLSSAWS